MPLTDLAKLCDLCPRLCRAKRLCGQLGYCGADGQVLVSRAALHFWEEPPISGTAGSGTVFFANCPLRCAYCQNQQISHGGFGAAVSVSRLAEIMLELEDSAAHNINLVTATQYADSVVPAIGLARADGLSIPVVWNSSGYERTSTIRLLSGSVDAYLMDCRYSSAELAGRYSDARDYPEVALAAIQAAVGEVGEYRLDDQGLIAGGVIVRFLLLPGHLDEAAKCLDRVYDAVGDKVCYSLLSQYTPIDGIASRFPELGQPVRPWDYDLLVDHLLDLGAKYSFMQEAGSAEAGFIPSFDLTGVLPTAAV